MIEGKYYQAEHKPVVEQKPEHAFDIEESIKHDEDSSETE